MGAVQGGYPMTGIIREIIALMSNTGDRFHTYHRTVGEGNSQDSLSIIAGLIKPGQTLLDLGMGAGGLGQHLSQLQTVVADGVTLNPHEADLARVWYREVIVADLDQIDLTTLFKRNAYDCIVCADVLEHLKSPEKILAQCKLLLNPGGRLITSIPNAGYCGLVAELIQGDFRYRPEGLLDSTHLRFFTRISLQRFFHENDWATQSITTTKRNLLESEFKVAFDGLPPAVARYLLAQPDALTYQFVSVLQLSGQGGQEVVGRSASGGSGAEAPTSAHALFSAQVYLSTQGQGQFQEADKLVVAGCIGVSLQTLNFDIPASVDCYTHVRLDPADRPGFFRLHHLTIRVPGGEIIWQWQVGQDALAVLAHARHQDMLFSPPWDVAGGAQLLLHGDDPWVELPLAQDVLQKMSQCGAQLEVGAGWPMSADYLQASATINHLQAAHQQSSAPLHQQIQNLSRKHARLESTRRDLQARLDDLSCANLSGQFEKQRMVAELRSKRRLVAELSSKRRENEALQAQLNQIVLHLQTIEHSTLFRTTRPLVHFKMRVDRLLGRTPNKHYMPQPSPQDQPVPVSQHPVHIIVPVYRGLEDTRCCLESVLAAPCQADWRLIVINDCSPEPEVTEWLRVFALRDTRIELHENTENLGFVATVNRGMALSVESDVLLLNSDAEVANDWLDRIQRAAYSAPRVASVTPFSNNATIFSYPGFCKSNQVPSGYNTASLDDLFAENLAGQTVEVPTAVGFCMYIRRQCLDEVGFFDVDNFGKGYGEENDFCIRAQLAGWTNLHALDTFVRHAGGVSFGDSKNEREQAAMQTMRRLHPRYESDVHAFVQRDPARQARLTIDLARITGSGRPVILNVMHNVGGGTLRHVQELVGQMGDQATFLRLTPASGGLDLRLEGPDEAFALHFAMPNDHPRLLHTMRQLQVCHIHYHHLLGHAPGITELPEQLGVTHDFTVHDYYSYCPQITLTDHTDRYCGEKGLEQCRQCLQRSPAPGGESIESWRSRHSRLLSQARYLIAPSVDVARRMQRFVPTARIQVVPHATLNPSLVAHPKPSPRTLQNGQPLRIVVLGALSKIKGADLLEAVADLAARHNAPVEFHLLGYAYRSLRTQPKVRLTVHGRYDESDLPLLLDWLKPDVVWFPAQCPETYSYTLSTCLALGLPVIAPNLGAFPERLVGRDWTWICPWDQTPEQWLTQLVSIGANHFQTGRAPQVPSASEDDESIEASEALYGATYLDKLDLSGSVVPEENWNLVQDFMAAPTRAPEQAAGFKDIALATLVRLRFSPMLSRVVRRVPLPLQKRVKSWLQS